MTFDTSTEAKRHRRTVTSILTTIVVVIGVGALTYLVATAFFSLGVN